MAKDILINEGGAPQIAFGDLKVGASDQQHAFLLLATEKGEWRHQPLLGVGISEFINDENPDVLLTQAIRVQCEADGASVNILSVNKGKIQLQVTYGTQL
jgi:hypothetical protein